MYDVIYTQSIKVYMHNQNESETMEEGKLYKYTNHIATYCIKFLCEPTVLSKCGILCAKEKLEEEVIKTIDEWSQPEQMDILDLKANVYDVFKFGSTIYFMSSYSVVIDLVKLH
jgi:hypothetical protein